MARVAHIATFYRIVKSNPPSIRDFRSYTELGIGRLGDDPKVRRLAEGISLYETFAQALKHALDRPYLGEFVAELGVPDDDPAFVVERTGVRTGHFTIWVAPLDNQAENLLNRVRATRRVIRDLA